MSASSPLPPKLYFRIGEVAGLVGVEPHVLRYWEREFRSIRPTKSAKGQRVYSRRDVENLMRVRELLYAEGFTIAGAKKKLQRSGSEPVPATIGLSGVALPDAGESSLASEDTARDLEDEVVVRRSHVVPAAAASPTLAGPALPRPARPTDARMRDALTALRREVESFLAELGG